MTNTLIKVVLSFLDKMRYYHEEVSQRSIPYKGCIPYGIMNIACMNGRIFISHGESLPVERGFSLPTKLRPLWDNLNSGQPLITKA